MIQSPREISATIAGAVIGGVVGYLMLTDSGRTLRRQMEPAFQEFSQDLVRFRNMLQEVTRVADESRMMVNDAFGKQQRSGRV